MSKKMLIDAEHPEETRVVVLDGAKVEDFDFESASKKPIRGNIYLAKVTRVEPSLQAAFVEYGGNRHGFLAFNEIHPDYYQIPYEDRLALAEAEASAEAADEKAAEERAEKRAAKNVKNISDKQKKSDTDSETPSDTQDVNPPEAPKTTSDATPKKLASDKKSDTDGSENDKPAIAETAPKADETSVFIDPKTESNPETEGEPKGVTAKSDTETNSDGFDTKNNEDKASETAQDEDAEDATELNDDSDDEDDIEEQKAARRRRQLYRKYKIQEVIKRRQILLVQAAKEERGNKGAALTTYLSLAGRYCVLMPNTPRGGGISRKISNISDRKRLKTVVNELDLPKGIGLIIRTAGASRTKVEIRRDADYLIRLWETIRELTLKSSAPTLIYEEGNLVKRSIRDLYDKEIDGVFVQGEEAYKEAKSFMKMLMPSHANRVHLYNEAAPLYLKYQVENQLESIYTDTVALKSGGYLVINPTEALVSIDVNSGRSTKERNIEATALKTNLEAASETARQMRLRDLAGLVVIDFIDMDEMKNNRAVEKRMKDALKRDRARLQTSRISQFGLMEISRQRRRASIIEGSTHTCPTCRGLGVVRSVESSALVALRGLEEEGMRGRAKRIQLAAPTSVVLYLLNDKRDHLLSIEEKFEMKVTVAADNDIILPDFTIQALETRQAGEERVIAPISIETVDVVETPSSNDAPEESSPSNDESHEGGERKRRRRRRSGGSSAQADETNTEVSEKQETGGSTETPQSSTLDSDGEDSPRRRRRRGRRGGRNRRKTEDGVSVEANENTDQATEGAASPNKPDLSSEPQPDLSASKETTTNDILDKALVSKSDSVATISEDAKPVETEDNKPSRRTRRPRKKADDVSSDAKPAVSSNSEKADSKAKEPIPASGKVETPAPKPKATSKPKADAPVKETKPTPEPPKKEPVKASETKKSDKPQKKGWWNIPKLFNE